MAAPTSTPPTPAVPPVPFNGELTISEDGIDVILTLVLRIGTNDMLDVCLRAISTVARIKRVAQP